MDDLITIRKAFILTGRNEKVIDSYIKEGKLSCQKVLDGDKKILKVSKNELVKVFDINIEYTSDEGEPVLEDDRRITIEEINEIIEEYFKKKESQLRKPLEELSIYRLGKLETEKQFLEDKIVNLLEENEEIKNQIKNLPYPIEEVLERLKKQEQIIEGLKKEKAGMEKEKKEKEGLKKKLDFETKEKETLLKEKEDLMAVIEKNSNLLKEEKKKLEKEKYEVIGKLQKEKDDRKEERNKLEEEKEKIAKTWKKELEEERNKSWWGKIFS